MKRRLISLLLVIVILFNFIYVRPVYAAGSAASDSTHKNPLMTTEAEGDTSKIGEETTEGSSIESSTYNSQSSAA